MWVKKNGGTAEDENFYAACVNTMLKAQSQAEFEKMEADLTDRWSPAFTDYFCENIRASVATSGLFATREMDIVSAVCRSDKQCVGKL